MPGGSEGFDLCGSLALECCLELLHTPFEKGGRGGICSQWCAIQAFSNPPDGTTSHSTRLSKYDSQVAGYHSPFSKGGCEDCSRLQAVHGLIAPLSLMRNLTHFLQSWKILTPFGSTKRNTVQIRGGPAAVSGDGRCKVARPATGGDHPDGKAQ